MLVEGKKCFSWYYGRGCMRGNEALDRRVGAEFGDISILTYSEANDAKERLFNDISVSWR